MKKIFCLIFVMMILLTGCTKPVDENVGMGRIVFGGVEESKPNPTSVPNTKQYADMSGYETYIEGNEYRFLDSSVLEMQRMILNKESFVVYFGFSYCPWCNGILNILNDTVEQFNSTIEYVDCRKDNSWESNKDIDNYDLLIQLIGDYLDVDSENNKRLYVPTVVFIKNGEIIDVVKTPNYNAMEEKDMPEEVKTEYQNTLYENFKKIKEN